MMRISDFLQITFCLLPTALAQWPSCDPSCVTCGLTCDKGCAAPLDMSICNNCLYCRRESSSCSFFELGYEDPNDPNLCELCANSCYCKLGAICYDGLPAGTATASAAPTAELGARMPQKGRRDLFGH
ncbi:uncharacterized protein BCR38DRAFT_239336 [Pseudomassariella vexata]|uniref:Uncharacterized protein n=1 Tax=Pseudomassariella vexata TaxID=1141098 RepID=A0A1Y2DT26_9PEZI|nr:uncharacterized protein BCR38DRAFT_239336 [Pseudomassariella vexata]ORY62407.1 hypothetical protein BCR38DRAFT_239336 [Pseudomassariella vexata]